MQRLIKNWLLLPLILLGLTPIIWFYGKGPVLINGVDTNFPLDPEVWFARRIFTWTNFPNAGIDFSSSVAGILFHLIQLIPYKLGLPLQGVQIISLVFWFGLIIFSSYIFARIIFQKNSLSQLLFVVLYSFNIYLFNIWENVKVANLSLMVAIPLALSLLILLKNGKVKKPKIIFLSSLVGIILSGSGINPSYFLTFLFIVAIFVLAQIIPEFRFINIKKVITNSGLVIMPIFLVNLFWMVPTASFVSKNVAPSGSIDKIGFANWVNSLSENTSLLNIMRMQGAWDWYAFDSVAGLPLYISYSLNYFYKFPFIAFSFLLPAIAILALILRRKGSNYNYLYLAFSFMLAIGVFLGAGTHLPTGDFFRWLANHIPFFTLFRSPWYIFTPLVVLSLAGLICLFFYGLEEGFAKRLKGVRFLIVLGVLVLIVGNLLYSYPLVSGKIFRPGRADGFFVSFPVYVFDAKAHLAQQSQGRIIGYPDDEIEKFSWGYRGIESILGLVVDQEVLFSPLNVPDAPVARIIREFYQALKKGELERASSLAAKLNVGILFEKEDQESLAPLLPPEVKINKLMSFDKWNFYEFPKQEFLPKIYSPGGIFFAPINKEGVIVLGVLAGSSATVNSNDTVVQSINYIKETAGKLILTKNSQLEEFNNQVFSPSVLSNRLTVRNPSVVKFKFEIKTSGVYEPVFERYKLEDFGIGLDGGELHINVNDSPASWKIKNISDSYINFEPVEFEAGNYTIAINLNSKNLIQGGDFEGGETFGTVGEGDFLQEDSSQGKHLTILNKTKQDISVNFQVFDFDPRAYYLIQFRYRQIYGNNAQALVGQNNDFTLIKAQAERLPNYPEWQSFSFYYQPVLTASFMKILLLAPQTEDPLGTKVQYDDIRVHKVFSNNLIFVKTQKADIAPAEVDFDKISPTQYEGEVKGGSDPHLIIFSENYSPEWKIALFDNSGRRIPINPLHFSVNLYANGWFINETPDDYKFKIFYRPQRLFLFAGMVSVATILLSAVWANWESLKRLTRKI